MRTIALITALAALVMMPAAAGAVEFVAVEGSADCNGWTSTATIWFRDGARSVDLAWTMVLADADGVELERAEGFEVLPISAGLVVPFTYSGAFASAPPAGAVLMGSYVLRDNFTDGFNQFTSGFAADVACDSGGGDLPAPLCTHSAGWWRRHRTEWPAETLDVAGEVWDRRDLEVALGRPAWGNPSLMLARQFVAATFNAMMNPGSGMDEALAAAAAVLADNDPFARSRRHRGRRDWRREAADVRELIVPLAAFNALGCEDEAATLAADDAMADVTLVQKALTGEIVPPDTSEDVSFGTLKARFR